MGILFIGLGTSGLRMLEHTQRFFYSTSKSNENKNCPDGVEFLFVETHTGVKRDRTPEGTAIQPVFMPIENPSHKINELRDYQVSHPIEKRWLPDPAQMNHSGVGAGGMRCFGRLALWSSAPRGRERHLEQLHERIKNHKNDKIMIVGSFAGGTCSGMFLDVAYLARAIMDPENQKDASIYGVFLLPETANTNTRLLANAFACLQDLDAFTKKDGSRFEALWPSDLTPTFKLPSGKTQFGFAKGVSPFKLVTLLSSEWENRDFSNLDDLYRIVGLYLFAWAKGFHDYQGARHVDAANAPKNQILKYSFFNLSALIFPKLEIEECLAAEKAQQLLGQMISASECRGKTIQGLIDDQVSKTKKKYIDEMDRIIGDSFRCLSSVGPDNSLEISLKKLFTEKNTGKSLEERLRTALVENGDVYNWVQNKAGTALSNIINGIYTLFETALEDSENLEYSRIVLSTIQKYLTDTLEMWNKRQIQQWDSLLTDLLQEFAESQHRMKMERKAVLLDRMNAIIDLLKMHCMYPAVNSIACHIKTGTEQNLRKSRLPTARLIDNLRAEIEQVIGGSSKAYDDFESLKTRHEKLIKAHTNNGDGDRKAKQLVEFYPKGDFEKEVESARNEFASVQSQSKSGECEKVLNYKGKSDSLWDYLTKDLDEPELLRERLLDDSLMGYWNLITNKCVENLDIEAFIRKHPEKLVKLAESATQESLRLKRPVSNSPDHPKVIIAGDPSIQKSAISALSKKDINDFPLTAKTPEATIRDLENMIIFFDERGDFAPLEHLVQIDAWERHYDIASRSKGVVDAYKYDASQIGEPIKLGASGSLSEASELETLPETSTEN